MEIVRSGYAPHGQPRSRPDVAGASVNVSKPAVSTPSLQTAILDRGDGLIAFIAAMLVAVACFFIAGTLPSFLLRSMDFWFEADTLREVSNMTRVHDDHYLTSVHPLFSLLTFVPVYVIKQVLSVNPL